MLTEGRAFSYLECFAMLVNLHTPCFLLGLILCFDSLSVCFGHPFL